jgi:effector-binding domain-containing protein
MVGTDGTGSGLRRLLAAALLSAIGFCSIMAVAAADTNSPASKAAAPSSAPPSSVPAAPPAPAAAKPAAPGDNPQSDGKPQNTEIEPNGTPGIPANATTEMVVVAARPMVMISGRSSYEDAFKSIKLSLETVKAAMAKAGLKPSGHPITIFSEPDKQGFKYKAGIPIAAKPTGQLDLGPDLSIGDTPAGKAIKFQHRGAYDDIDSTYDVITAYLDAKGLQANNPYIEEYVSDLTTPDDPNLQVDIYVFVKS